MTDLVTIARGDASRIVEPRRMIVRTAEEWRTLWALHAGPDAALPPIDFASRAVAAVFAGERPSSGYRVEIVDAGAGGSGVGLAVEQSAPARGAMAAQVLTFPFHIVSLPPGPIAWIDATPTPAPVGDSGSARQTPTRTPEPTSSSTGLQPRTAAALAYLAGPASGALMLLAESANRDVRFHAWQSILAIGGLGVLVLLGYVLAVGSLFVSASAVAGLVRVANAAWFFLLLVWALCLWKAWGGGRWKLPLAGGWAERLSSR